MHSYLQVNGKDLKLDYHGKEANIYIFFFICRYENDLPGVDIFVCTADPKTEQPIMVINTVLSVMAYDYPTEKLSIYLSDDAAHDITFYALIEASHFAKHWIPYCKKFYVEPRSPGAYFQSISEPHEAEEAKGFLAIKVQLSQNIV